MPIDEGEDVGVSFSVLNEWDRPVLLVVEDTDGRLELGPIRPGPRSAMLADGCRGHRSALRTAGGALVAEAYGLLCPASVWVIDPDGTTHLDRPAGETRGARVGAGSTSNGERR
ncbi:hypothetical protein LO762_27685 [Actinocorallia sp. API 0066]|uniref:hypothetical protein n=1 Tax=Actinocorallia sp. API 0066 TaxID=2896846 RepID=UPI001E4510A6|nr:hypothetical protein [Actinocorallia sp. API 0066]MCD0452933.1 hypothetical protein [Actinocorallia sp. API 0066]